MSIVQINVSVTNPPKPSKLLQSGVIVSTGGTNLQSGGTAWVSSTKAAQSVITPESAISSISWSSNTVTISLTDTIPDEFGDSVDIVVSQVVPSEYNGTYTATINRDDNSLSYQLFTDPGASISNGVVNSVYAVEVNEMIDSFFAQGKTRSVCILELGAGTEEQTASALSDFIADDVELGFVHQQYFAYLVPRAFAENLNFLQLTGRYTNPNDMVYFFVTGSTSSMQNWITSDNKSVFFMVESPDKPDGEFSCANAFQSALANEPGSSNMVPPMAYRFMYGTTAYPAAGNADMFKAFAEESVNYIGSGAEGGISNRILVKGHNLDGMPFNYWYAIAWTAINLGLNLANEIINGSNSTLNPLYYDQRGINRLQQRALSTLRTGISYGLLLGEVVGTTYTQEKFIEELDKGSFAGNVAINAVGFQNYSSLNPSDYADGVYNGLSAVITPRRGFESITFNLNVTNFVGA